MHEGVSMSSPAAKPGKPVELANDALAQLYANLHPALLSGLIVFNFPSLVRDPINTLLAQAPLVALLQAAYCIICLPSTGQTAPAGAKAGPKKKSPKAAQDIWAKLVVRRTWDAVSPFTLCPHRLGVSMR